MIDRRHDAPQRLHQALAELAAVQLEAEQERLRRTEVETLFDTVLRAMFDAVLLTDPAGRVRRANPSAAQLLGVPESDLIGRMVPRFAGEGFPARIWDILSVAPHGQLSREVEVLRASGERVPVSLAASVVRDPAGKVVGAVYSLRDLSETQRLLHDLGAAEARWRLLAEISADLAATLDPSGELERVCGRVAAATGRTCAIALVDDSGVAFEPAAGAGDASLAEVVRDALTHGPARGALLTALGRLKPIHAEVCPPDFPLLGTASAAVRSAALVPVVARGKLIGALFLVGSEPRAVREAEVAVAEAVAGRVALAVGHQLLHEEVTKLASARERDRVRHDVFSAVTHDIITPIAVLQAGARVLEQQDLPPESRDMAVALSRQADRLLRLFQGFMDFVRLEAGTPLNIMLRATDVREPVHRGIALFSIQRPVRTRIEDDVPAVVADPDRLEQVVANLVSNAVKFSDAASEVVVSVRRATDGVHLSVTDRGRGINQSDVAHLFDRFYRGSEEGRSSGTGLGLYLTKALVEAMGGRIWVESRVGEGSTFTVALKSAVRGENPDELHRARGR